MKRLLWLVLALAAVTTCSVFVGGAAVAADGDDVVIIPKDNGDDEADVPPSGAIVNIGSAITECPQAGLRDRQPKPNDLRQKDEVEKLSDAGNDIRFNQDYSCFPQDETAIAVNPADTKNVLGSANDYRLGWGTSGFYASTDNGEHFYDGIRPFPTNANSARDHIDGGGDPSVVFDRGGTAYYNDLHFMRENDESGIFVARSTNGGFTWSRPCIPAGSTDTAARCGGNGDVRRPGDGVVAYTPDNDNALNGSVPSHDKNYMTAGPRPTGVTPTCFAPISKTAIPAGQTGCANDLIGPDRLYVTWTIFFGPTAKIYFSYSDDRAYSWSPPKEIDGTASFCTGGVHEGDCDANQGSVPTVNPTTGELWVAFENFNTPDENQYVVVRSTNGGQTFQGPFFISPVFDLNYPRSGSPSSASTNRLDCFNRGQGGRNVLTNSCFRVNSYGNIAADPRGGAFADDLYVVLDDNRDGQRVSSNTDVSAETAASRRTARRGSARLGSTTTRQGSRRLRKGRATAVASPVAYAHRPRSISGTTSGSHGSTSRTRAT